MGNKIFPQQYLLDAIKRFLLKLAKRLLPFIAIGARSTLIGNVVNQLRT